MSMLKYRPEIDGLRAIAVLAVVIYHADPRLLPGGFVGVDVFFVISGYLITALLAAEWQRAGRIDFAAFYARRARRILPASIVLVLAVMAAAVLLLGRYGEVFDRIGESAVASLLFLANVYFQYRSGGYFDAPVDGMALLHLWSLSVEEQFYLVYPLLLMLLLRFFPGGVKRRLVVLALASMLLAEYWVHILPERAFFQMPARFWELAAGALVALSTARALPVARDRWLLPTGLLVIGGAYWFTPMWGYFPAAGALPAVTGAALVLLAVHRGAVDGLAGALLRTRPFVAIGLVSYSLYLWHWPLLAIDGNLRFDPAPISWRLALCVLALGLAWLSWRYVELPFRRAGGTRPARALAIAAMAMLLSLVAVVGLAQVDRVPPDARRIAEQARTDSPANRDTCSFDFNQTVESLRPSTCASRPDQQPTVAYWGDSHAWAWQPFAWHLAEASGESAAGATMNSCQPTVELDVEGFVKSTPNCTALNRLALAWLASGQVNTLIIARRWPMGTPGGDIEPAGLEAQIAGLEGAVQQLAGMRRILVMGPLPLLRRPAPECISTGREVDCSIARTYHEKASQAVRQQLAGLAARHANVDVIDPTDFFCDKTRCTVTRDGYALYWDDDHISSTAAREFAKRFLADPARYTLQSSPHPGPPP